jgi:hypothetical protein
MIKRHSVKNGAGTLQRAAMPVQGDGEREIRNGYPPGVYLPADPGRRKRLLEALGYHMRNNEEEEDVIKTMQEDPDYMLEGYDA